MSKFDIAYRPKIPLEGKTDSLALGYVQLTADSPFEVYRMYVKYTGNDDWTSVLTANTFDKYGSPSTSIGGDWIVETGHKSTHSLISDSSGVLKFWSGYFLNATEVEEIIFGVVGDAAVSVDVEVYGMDASYFSAIQPIDTTVQDTIALSGLGTVSGFTVYDGDFYVLDSENSNVVKFSGLTNTQDTTVDLSDNLGSLVFDSSGNMVTASDRIKRYDGFSSTVLDDVPMDDLYSSMSSITIHPTSGNPVVGFGTDYVMEMNGYSTDMLKAYPSVPSGGINSLTFIGDNLLFADDFDDIHLVPGINISATPLFTMPVPEDYVFGVAVYDSKLYVCARGQHDDQCDVYVYNLT